MRAIFTIGALVALSAANVAIAIKVSRDVKAAQKIADSLMSPNTSVEKDA